MNLQRISIAAIQAIGLGLLPAAALAATINDTTTFVGTVPGTCSYSGGSSQTVPMDYNAAFNGSFNGVSQPISISCNTGADVSLSAVTPGNSNPTTTSNLATLKNSAGQILTESGSEESEKADLSNSAGTNTVTITLDVGDASIPGNYSYEVVLTTTFS